MVTFYVYSHHESPFEGHVDVEFTVVSGNGVSGSYTLAVLAEDVVLYPIHSRHQLMRAEK